MNLRSRAETTTAADHSTDCSVAASQRPERSLPRRRPRRLCCCRTFAIGWRIDVQQQLAPDIVFRQKRAVLLFVVGWPNEHNFLVYRPRSVQRALSHPRQRRLSMCERQ